VCFQKISNNPLQIGFVEISQGRGRSQRPKSLLWEVDGFILKPSRGWGRDIFCTSTTMYKVNIINYAKYNKCI